MAAFGFQKQWPYSSRYLTATLVEDGGSIQKLEVFICFCYRWKRHRRHTTDEDVYEWSLTYLAMQRLFSVKMLFGDKSITRVRQNELQENKTKRNVAVSTCDA